MQAFAYAVAVLLITVARAAAIDITACGQNVPDGEVGDLVASLDCTGVGGHCVDDPDVACTADQDVYDAVASGCLTWGVRLGSRATLRLNVFVENVNLVHEPTVGCESYPLLSGRKLRGSNVTATHVLAERGIDLAGLTVDGSPGCSDGVTVLRGRVRLTDSSITGAPRFDLVTKTRPQLVNTTCGTSRRIGRGGITLEDTTWGVCGSD